MPKQRAAKASVSPAKKKKSSRAKNSGVNATQIILNVTATLAHVSGSKDVPRDKMIAFAKCEGVMGKSTIANALTKLKKAGLIIMNPGIITITDEGMDQADVNSDMNYASNEEYHKVIKKKMKLNARACKLFDELADGKVRNKKEVAAAIGTKMNSTWANMLTPLKKLRVIEFEKETINLTNDMFPFGRPVLVE